VPVEYCSVASGVAYLNKSDQNVTKLLLLGGSINCQEVIEVTEFMLTR
jgi:hypothetical protein